MLHKRCYGIMGLDVEGEAQWLKKWNQEDFNQNQES